MYGQSLNAISWFFFPLFSARSSLLDKDCFSQTQERAEYRSASREGNKRNSSARLRLRISLDWVVPEMVGHLHLQAMDDSLKGKNREGLLDSPDSGLPPSPSPPFCSLSPALIESRSGSCTTPVESHHGYYKKESREGKLVRSCCVCFIIRNKFVIWKQWSKIKERPNNDPAVTGTESVWAFEPRNRSHITSGCSFSLYVQNPLVENLWSCTHAADDTEF